MLWVKEGRGRELSSTAQWSPFYTDWSNLANKVTFELRPKRNKNAPGKQRLFPSGKVFQKEGTASTKAWRQECAWHVEGRTERPLRLADQCAKDMGEEQGTRSGGAT